MQNFLSKINYIYLFFAILWVPFQKVILKVDGAGLSIMTFTIIILIINLCSKTSKKLLLSKPILFWGLWVLYSGINLYVKGYNNDFIFYSFFIIQLLLPFTVMLVSARECIMNRKKTLQLLLLVFLCYGFLGLYLIGFTYAFDRGGQDFSVNLLALNVLFLIFFALLMYAHKWIKLRHVLILSSIALFLIFSTATRKALGTAGLFFFFSLISKFRFSVSKIFGLATVLSIFYFASIYLLSNSLIGERLMEIEESGIRANTTDIEALNILGDRVFFYIDGWNFFTENPLTGIGLRNFANLAENSITIHSEYMVQLTENGIIGVLLFLLFNVWIGKSLFINIKNNRVHRHLYLTLLGGFVGILFINFTAWTYAFPQYFAVFGIIISYLKQIKINDSNKQYRI
jgi:O-antigen ligase